MQNDNFNKEFEQKKKEMDDKRIKTNQMVDSLFNKVDDIFDTVNGVFKDADYKENIQSTTKAGKMISWLFMLLLALFILVLIIGLGIFVYLMFFNKPIFKDDSKQYQCTVINRDITTLNLKCEPLSGEK